MILLEISEHTAAGVLTDQPYYDPLIKSINYLTEKCQKDIDPEVRDGIYEYENRCVINYRFNKDPNKGPHIRSILFKNDADYTWWLVKWSS